MMHKTIDRRLEVKAVGDQGSFTAYGSVFGNIDLHRDIVVPGAFEKSLSRHKSNGTMPSMLWQHDMRQVIGKYSDMREDEKGLLLEGELFIDSPIHQAKEAHYLMKAKAVTGFSIGFNIPKGGQEYDEDKDCWEIKEIDLVEVSLVTYPANQQARLETVKSAMETPKFFERFLRDAGLSRIQAKSLMSGGYGVMCESRDVDADANTEAIKAAQRLFNLIGDIKNV